MNAAHTAESLWKDPRVSLGGVTLLAIAWGFTSGNFEINISSEGFDSITPDNTIPPSTPQPTGPTIYSTPEMKEEMIALDTPIPTKELEDYTTPGFTPETNEGLILNADKIDVDAVKNNITNGLNGLNTSAPEITFTDLKANANEFKDWANSLDGNSYEDLSEIMKVHNKISGEPASLQAYLEGLVNGLPAGETFGELSRMFHHLVGIQFHLEKVITNKWGITFPLTKY